MTDTNRDETKPADQADEAYRRAKKGQDDDGQIVTGALGEPFNGSIADVTDNEPGRQKK